MSAALAMTDLSGLFAPFQLGNLTLKNRIVMPAMGLAVCEDGAPNEGHADYYARRAAGGASLVMTEGVYIDHPSSGDNPLLSACTRKAASSCRSSGMLVLFPSLPTSWPGKRLAIGRISAR